MRNRLKGNFAAPASLCESASVSTIRLAVRVQAMIVYQKPFNSPVIAALNLFAEYSKKYAKCSNTSGFNLLKTFAKSLVLKLLF